MASMPRGYIFEKGIGSHHPPDEPVPFFVDRVKWKTYFGRIRFTER